MKNVLKASSLLLILLTSIRVEAQTNIWQPRRPHTHQDLTDVTFGKGMFVAVGQRGAIISSPDGTNWTLRAYGTNFSDGYTGVAYGNGVFVAVGNERRQIRTSNDGVHWGTAREGANELYDITFAKGRFVAVGTAILTSTDGTNWMRVRRIGLARTVAFGDDRFVALAENDRIWTSRNGVRWTNQLMELAGTFTDMAYNGSDFIAFAEDADLIYMYSSPGGIHWSPSAQPSFVVNGLTHAKDVIVAVGENRLADPPGRIHVSSDGLTWPGEPVVVVRPLYAAAYGRGTIVAVGQQGMIVQANYAEVAPAP